MLQISQEFRSHSLGVLIEIKTQLLDTNDRGSRSAVNSIRSGSKGVEHLSGRNTFSLVGTILEPKAAETDRPINALSHFAGR